MTTKKGCSLKKKSSGWIVDKILIAVRYLTLRPNQKLRFKIVLVSPSKFFLINSSGLEFLSLYILSRKDPLGAVFAIKISFSPSTQNAFFWLLKNFSSVVSTLSVFTRTLIVCKINLNEFRVTKKSNSKNRTLILFLKIWPTMNENRMNVLTLILIQKIFLGLTTADFRMDFKFSFKLVK